MPRVNASDYYSYEEAKIVVQKLGIESFKKWCDYISPSLKVYDANGNLVKKVPKPVKDRKDPRLPSDPRTFYMSHGKKWGGWGEFLGTGNVAPSHVEFLDYAEAKIQVHRLGITSRKMYQEMVALYGIKHLPKFPEYYYPRHGVKFLWRDFLAPKFVPFEEARDYVRSLGNVKNYQDWIAYSKSGNRPVRIPAAPRDVYRAFWVSWPDFLGSKNKARPPKEKASLKLAD